MLLDDGFSFVGCLRDDAALDHRANPEEKGKQGRPKTKDGWVDFANLSQFEILNQDDKESIYTAIVKSKALKIDIRIVYVI